MLIAAVDASGGADGIVIEFISSVRASIFSFNALYCSSWASTSAKLAKSFCALSAVVITAANPCDNEL